MRNVVEIRRMTTATVWLITCCTWEKHVLIALAKAGAVEVSCNAGACKESVLPSLLSPARLFRKPATEWTIIVTAISITLKKEKIHHLPRVVGPMSDFARPANALARSVDGLIHALGKKHLYLRPATKKMTIAMAQWTKGVYAIVVET